jgi:hypothetical protein
MAHRFVERGIIQHGEFLTDLDCQASPALNRGRRTFRTD